LFQGRDTKTSGAHTIGYNSKSLSVCILGNYDIRKLELLQEDTLINLLAWLTQIHKIDAKKIIGHRDVTKKSCPGTNIYSKLPEIREKIEMSSDL
jgi:N-acetyl-anhydromuramyl-L-alanine amidase AmpD